MTNVVTGFVVRKRFRKDVKGGYSEHTVNVSQKFMSRDAADTFLRLAEENYKSTPVDGEREVEFYVVGVMGKDEVPKGM
jgi:hypothetical protein